MYSFDRRSFLRILAAAPGALLGEHVHALGQMASNQGTAAKPERPPLFCLAYIDPLDDLSAGQIREISRFPVAILPQDDRPRFMRWKDEIRASNPDITLLAYQVAVEETTVPGPGHRSLSKANGQWVSYGGITPSHKSKRFFDPRSKAWQVAFIDACTETLDSYAYDGLFLDQCSVFTIMVPHPLVRIEMMNALQETLLQIRSRHKNKIIVANSRYNWTGLNGEMNEGMPESLTEETSGFAGHQKPRMDMFFHYITNDDLETAEQMMHLALRNNCYFGCAPNPQTVRWYPFFDMGDSS